MPSQSERIARHCEPRVASQVGGNAGLEAWRVVSVFRCADALRCFHALERSKWTAASEAMELPRNCNGGRCEVEEFAIVAMVDSERFYDLDGTPVEGGLADSDETVQLRSR